MSSVQNVQIKNIIIGQGTPKIIVPIMPKDLEHIDSAVAALTDTCFDILEWRVDHFEDANDINKIEQIKLAAQKIKTHLNGIPLLFTFRTAKEGGEKNIPIQDYTLLNLDMIESGLIDAIDVELFTGEESVKTIITAAHLKGIKVIASSHDFDKTPPKEEIIARLCQMQELGADILKIAVMPKNKSDVLTLLAATLEMHEHHAKRPLITMSMGAMGAISRICGETFGSAASFGAIGQISAPGQFDVKNLRTMLDLLHQAQ